MVCPVLLRSPEVHLRLIVEWPLKRLESFEMLPLMGVAVLILSLSALVLGYLGHQRVADFTHVSLRTLERDLAEALDLLALL